MEERPMSIECRFLYAACRPGEFWVYSKGADGKPTFRRLANLSWLFEICNHFGDIAAWSPKSLKMVAQNLPFWKKVLLRANFQKMFSERIHHLSDPRLVCKFREIWLNGNRQSRALFTSHKNLPRAPAFASERIAPKICHGQLQTTYSECSKFHPNPYTYGGVIAGRVNIVETRHKVLPIHGEASSPSNYGTMFFSSCLYSVVCVWWFLWPP